MKMGIYKYIVLRVLLNTIFFKEGVKMEVKQENLQELRCCQMCPHNCKINRIMGDIGRCKAKDTVKIALASIHHFEEPCISGEKGSGTIFFSNCNLNCLYCQNYEISQEGIGKEISIEQLSQIILEQQEKNVENINLVTPTSYVPQICEAIKKAKEKGLKIPIVYNTNGYEKVETIQRLNGIVDVYLPDLKYAENEIGKKYSKVDHYFETATAAIQEMVKQVGFPVLNQKGMIQKGVMIRHLVLPNHIDNSKQVLKWIQENMPSEIFISIMAQYFPTYQAKQDSKLNRKLTKEEWEEIEKYIEDLGFENGYVQELGDHEEEYVPKWDV